MTDDATPKSPRERGSTLWPSPRAGGGRRSGWSGPTYYGRPQLKSAPFNNWIVGGYIFLAGLSGSGGTARLPGPCSVASARDQARGTCAPPPRTTMEQPTASRSSGRGSRCGNYTALAT